MPQQTVLKFLAVLLGLLAFLPARANMAWGGVNLAGAEFGSAVPGTPNVDFVWPSNAEIDYFHDKGMNALRVPFKWERMQPAMNGPLAGTYLSALDALVAHAASKGMTIILDPHNYARYGGNVVGTAGLPNAAFADFWTRLATHFAGNESVIFGLMNEPNSMPTEQWAAAANAAIASIRAAGSQQLILVPGNAWTGAHSWSQNWYGTPNATAMLAIVDSSNHFAFELHQYFDSDHSGTSATCMTTPGTGANELQDVTSWLRTHGYKGFLGEFAGADNSACQAAIISAMEYLKGNADVWLGWTWWAAGPWWGSYMYTLEPTNGFSTDAPQMNWLLPYMPPLFANGFDD
jgi:endoglucanase